MHWASMLVVSAEVGIGIAGFAGIFAAVARRTPEHWGATSALTLRVLLSASGAAIFASLLPFVLLEAGLPEGTVWSFASALFGIWTVGVLTVRLREHYRALGTAPPPAAITRYAIAAATAVLLVVNAALLHAPWPYRAAVYCNLLLAFLAFVRLLRAIS